MVLDSTLTEEKAGYFIHVNCTTQISLSKSLHSLHSGNIKTSYHKLVTTSSTISNSIVGSLASPVSLGPNPFCPQDPLLLQAPWEPPYGSGWCQGCHGSLLPFSTNSLPPSLPKKLNLLVVRFIIAANKCNLSKGQKASSILQ